MGKKMPRFEDGQALSASKLNQIAEAVEGNSTSSEKYVDAVGCPSCGSDKVACKAGDEAWTWKCQNCGAIGDLQLQFQPVVKGQDAKEPVKTFGQADCPKAVWGEVVEHWKAEAKKAFAERDTLKAKLRQVAPSVAAEEWQKQFYKDVDVRGVEDIPPGEGPNVDIDLFLDLLEDAEKENKTITRIDVPAELLKEMRGFDREVFRSNSGALFRDTGMVGQLHLITPIDVYLNNDLDGKARLYLEKVGYREYEFPAEPAVPN